MLVKTLPDIKAAWEYCFFSMLDDKPGVIDYYQRNIIHSFGNKISAKSAVFDYDLGALGLTITKMSKFTGMYVGKSEEDVGKLHAWVDNAMNVRSYDSLYLFKPVAPNFSGKKAVKQWGNCLLGLSFRRQPKPATLTLYTRAQSLGFSGVADYALLHFVAKKLAERMGVEQSDIKVVIHCSNFIIKMVEVLHNLEYRGLLDEYAARDNRIGESIRYYQDYISNDAPELKWRAANRMRTKMRNVQAGVFRTLPVDEWVLKGYEHSRKIAPKRTLREAQSLVLVGSKGKAPVDLGISPTLIEVPA
jgi:hypothetical protein